MSQTEVREPIQQRSIEKKQKIVEAGFQLFSSKGYHNTNTVEIAKAAGVSTGSVYSYFKDKKAIFLAIMDYYAYSITEPMLTLLNTSSTTLDLHCLLEQVLDTTLQSHIMGRDAHQEMMAMSQTDKEVHAYIVTLEETIVNSLVEILPNFGLTPEFPREKTYIAYRLMESFCHEFVYNPNSGMNYTVMRNEVITMIATLMTKSNTRCKRND